MTVHGDHGHRKRSVEDHLILVRLVNTNKLPPRATNSVSPSNTVNLQVVHRNNKDIQKTKLILSEKQAPTTHVNFECHFFQKLYKIIKCVKVVKRILCWKYLNSTGEIIYQQAVVVPVICMLDIIRTMHEDIMQGHPGSKKILYILRQRYYCPNLTKKDLSKPFGKNVKFAQNWKPLPNNSYSPRCRWFTTRAMDQ